MYSQEVIILVGGLGTRLRSLISDRPKALAPICGRPFLSLLLDSYARQKVSRIHLAVGYMAEKIKEEFGNNWRGVELNYSTEENPLGTGGATLLALEKLQGSSVHICNGDTWLMYSLRNLELQTKKHNAHIGMALAHVDDTSRYGAVTIKDEYILSFQEKGITGKGWINAGAYFFNTKAIDALHTFPKNTFFSLEKDFLYNKVANKRILAFKETENFIDIGIPSDYAKANELFK